MTVVSFTGNRAYDRGSCRSAGLWHDGAGFLWGTTEKRGANGVGTVFKFHIATGELTTLVDLEPLLWSSETTEVVVDTTSTLTVRDTVHTSADSSRFLRIQVSAP